MFEAALLVTAIVAGAIASIAGFGIGSLLTPVLAIETGAKLAVAAVSVPHLVGTGLRFWYLRHSVDSRVLWSFGVTSAAGGLAGALLHAWAANPVLAAVFGALLLFAGLSELTGLARRMRFGRRGAWVAGAVSGMFGGLVGNQGGIRSAALLGFDVRPQAFVATATAIGLAVDAARIPVYFATEGAAIAERWPLVLVATVGVVLGTAFGTRLLRRVPEPLFRRAVAALVAALGVYMLWRASTG
jgi:uncharacterized membrane protein YfcA